MFSVNCDLPQAYTSPQTPQVVHIKYVHLFVCWSYLKCFIGIVWAMKKAPGQGHKMLSVGWVISMPLNCGPPLFPCLREPNSVHRAVFILFANPLVIKDLGIFVSCQSCSFVIQHHSQTF